METPNEKTDRSMVRTQISNPTEIPETTNIKTKSITTTNEKNAFLSLPQEVHNAIFLHLVDPSKVSRISSVDHAGIATNTNTRHVQCSTPTLRALLPLLYSCKQLCSEFAETSQRLRSATFHHFRILDDDDFLAFQLFFSNTKALHHRITRLLKVTIPAKSSHLTVALAILASLPEALLQSLTLELPSYARQQLYTPGPFLHGIEKSNRVLQLSSMVCTRVSHRRFDGMWSLQYESVESLTKHQKDAWAVSESGQGFNRGPRQQGWIVEMGSAGLERTGVQKWRRSLRALEDEGEVEEKQSERSVENA